MEDAVVFEFIYEWRRNAGGSCSDLSFRLKRDIEQICAQGERNNDRRQIQRIACDIPPRDIPPLWHRLSMQFLNERFMNSASRHGMHEVRIVLIGEVSYALS